MPAGFKLLMLLSTPFPLRPSAAALRFARHTRQPLAAFSSSAACNGRLLSTVSDSKLGFSIRPAEQVHVQAVAREGCGETMTSTSALKDLDSWPEWSKLTESLLAKGFTERSGEEDDSFLLEVEPPEEFLKAAEACLGFARKRPDILRLLAKKNVKALVENGSPFLFKNGWKSVNRMKLYLSDSGSSVMESEKAETIDLMRYLLSYVYKHFPAVSENHFKADELVEASVRKLLVELLNLNGTLWKSELTDSTATEFTLAHDQSPGPPEQLSRPPGQSVEMKRGDWICPKCTFMNFARNMNCLECDEARPKRQLTGAEWECPQCNFFNYGRNTSCLRCDCKRPGDPLTRYAPTVGLGGYNRNSNIESQIVSVHGQDSNGVSSTKLDSNSSNSISHTLDRILGRSSMPSNSEPIASGNFSSSEYGQRKKHHEGIPFVPLPSDMFKTTPESKNGMQQSSYDKSDMIDSLLKSSEKPSTRNDGNESSDASALWPNKAAELENVKNPTNAVSDEDFPDIMPMRKGENRFVVSKKKDRSFTSPAYKRRLAMEQANSFNSVPFVPFPPGYFAKKDNESATEATDNVSPSSISSSPLEKVEAMADKQPEQKLGNPYKPDFSNQIGASSAAGTFQQVENQQSFSENRNDGTAGKSLEGSLVKEPDPLDMSEEAKAERWFRRAAQIKDISELSQIPDEDFPEIMPLRKGVNRFVVSKRKTPLERRLTSPQYRRNLPIVSSEPEKDFDK
ncbi:Zinc finger protein VAR3, chloroplastic [Apostasia shenzhenica]|uniref:Zinc finger protein VAR3, chloroplastic n=1 Tax=Apostasia shenzhenica TaxID=1088818 RepID=A0A2I0A6K7_9ASPA|nr:Zinc finger protein VAR3, chloroplastic [Apostasia shenzhenica]